MGARAKCPAESPHSVRRQRLWALGGLLLLILPIAAAAAVDGQLSYEGEGVLPAGALARGHPLAFLANRTAGVTEFELVSPLIQVHYLYVEAGMDLGVLKHDGFVQARTYNLTNVTMTLVSTTDVGWVGVYAGGSMLADLRAQAPAVTRPSLTSLIATDEQGVAGAGSGEEPGTDRQYRQALSFPHVAWSAPGVAAFQGDGAVKFEGLHLRWQADENSSSLETYSRRPKVNPVYGQTGVYEEAWALLEFQEAQLRINTSAPFQAAFERAEVSWDGPAYLSDASGALQGGSVRYEVEEGVTRLEGRFAGSLLATTSAGGARGWLTLSGDLVSSDATVVPLPVGGAARAASWLLPAAAAVVVAAGGAALLVARRRQGKPLTVEQCEQLARDAAEEGRHSLALEWTRRALELAPGSSRLWTEEAFHLSQMGEVEAAVASYEQASRLSEDGEADYLAAGLLAATGDSTRAKPRLLRALARSPTLALEAEEDERLRALRADHEVRAALRRALDRMRQGE